VFIQSAHQQFAKHRGAPHEGDREETEYFIHVFHYEAAMRCIAKPLRTTPHNCHELEMQRALASPASCETRVQHTRGAGTDFETSFIVRSGSKVKLKSISIVVAGLLSAAPAFAAPVTLDFEGTTSFGSISQYYNGGTDTGGASGTNFGVSLGLDALAFRNDELGTYFTNPPSGDTVMAAVGPSAALNAATDGAFVGQVSFQYSSSQNITVGIFDGLDGTGNEIGTFNLFANAQTGCVDSAFCHWDLVSLNFAGAAKSVQFGNAWSAVEGVGSVAAFDDVTVSPVPVPAAAWLLASGLAVLGKMRRRRAQA
jgi:hypothetical protein